MRSNPNAPETTTRAGVTVAIGVAAFPDDAQTDLELINAADRRLYHAKPLGRNRVVS
jgi:diguanylate cyclase (GGDEF)-like protein